MSALQRQSFNSNIDIFYDNVRFYARINQWQHMLQNFNKELCHPPPPPQKKISRLSREEILQLMKRLKYVARQTCYQNKRNPFIDYLQKEM